MSLTWKRARCWLAVVALLFAALSCSRANAPSEVAQGRYFSAGSFEYDEFFVHVYRLQSSTAAAPNELTEARRLLADALGSPADASNAQLAETLRLLLEHLVERGVQVRAEFRVPTTPDPPRAQTLFTYSSPPEGTERATLERVEAAMTRILGFIATNRADGARLTELRGAISRLDARVDATFAEHTRGRRAQIRDNLHDAERMTLVMLTRTGELARAAESLASELERALAPYAKPWPVVPPSEPAPPPEPPRHRLRSPESRGRPGAAKEKPAGEAPKSADFEP